MKYTILLFLAALMMFVAGCGTDTETIVVEKDRCYAQYVEHDPLVYQIVGMTQEYFIVRVWNGWRWKLDFIAVEKWKVELGFEEVACEEFDDGNL